MVRVAVVTGGTRGIGEAVSKALKAAGYNVAANYGGNDEAAGKFKEKTGIAAEDVELPREVTTIAELHHAVCTASADLLAGRGAQPAVKAAAAKPCDIAIIGINEAGRVHSRGRDVAVEHWRQHA